MALYVLKTDVLWVSSTLHGAWRTLRKGNMVGVWRISGQEKCRRWHIALSRPGQSTGGYQVEPFTRSQGNIVTCLVLGKDYYPSSTVKKKTFKAVQDSVFLLYVKS